MTALFACNAGSRRSASLPPNQQREVSRRAIAYRHSESVTPIPMPVIPTTIVAATIIAVPVIAIVITVGPIRPVIPAVVGISGIVTVVRIGVVIAGSVEGREWNGESKGKVNTGACRRFREERQSSDRKNEDNELLHNQKRRKECITNSRN